ncbi:MAG: ATP-binding cassette domain-containing protein [Eubacteriales bacterium]|nr:ATP-binding cassette domain-containing protein [Eubacteriales bacterium]
MKKDFFCPSQTAGILYEVVSYALLLLCGYLLSDLLELALAGSWRQMYRTGLLAAAALLLTLLPKYALSVWRNRQKQIDSQHFREYLYQCVLNRTIRVENRGEMNVLLNSDADTIASYFQETRPKAISGAAVLLCSAVLLCTVDWRIGLLFFLLNLTQFLPIIVYEKWSRQLYRQTHSAEETYCNWMLEGYNGIRTLKAYGAEQWYLKRYYRLNQEIVRSGKRTEKAIAVENIVFQAIDSLLNYGSYVILGLFVLFGGLPIEKTPLLIILGGYLFSSISSVFDLRLQQFQYQEAVKRLGFHEIQPVHSGGSCILKAENLSKTFEGKQVLNHASCAVYSGDRILLQGDNGSGKSTFLRILAGLEEPDSGRVTYGIPQNEIALSLQEEPQLNIPGKELVHALNETGCIHMEQLAQHFQGFHILELLAKPLSELSSGERKKFYLAAALAHRGKLLILDEPTNHLDQASIAYLYEQLRAYTGTFLICTHTTDMDLNWNKTLLMDGGICHEP